MCKGAREAESHSLSLGKKKLFSEQVLGVGNETFISAQDIMGHLSHTIFGISGKFKEKNKVHI